MRIGVNALYLIPGGVGGTEIYLRELLPALAEIDRVNEYYVFTNRETSADLVPFRSAYTGKESFRSFLGIGDKVAQKMPLCPSIKIQHVTCDS